MQQASRDRPGESAFVFTERVFGADRVIRQNARQLGDQAREVLFLSCEVLDLAAFLANALPQRCEQRLPPLLRAIQSREFGISRLGDFRQSRLLGGNLAAQGCKFANSSRDRVDVVGAIRV